MTVRLSHLTRGDDFFPVLNKRVGDLYKRWEQYRDELLSLKSQRVENYSFLIPEHISRYQQVIEEEKSQNPDFEMYYDIRRPVFDYFKNLLFMPAKHCIYRNWKGPGGDIGLLL